MANEREGYREGGRGREREREGESEGKRGVLTLMALTPA